MFKRLKIVGTIACVFLALILVLATPALAAGPSSPKDRGGKGGVPAPPFAEGIFTKSDVKTAAKFLGIEADELENQLWAGRTLAEIADTVGADITALRNAVDAERYHKLSEGKLPGALLSRGDRDDSKACRDDKDCRDDCDKGKDCSNDCDRGKDCGAKDDGYKARVPEKKQPDVHQPGKMGPDMSGPHMSGPGMAPPSGAWMRTTARGGLNLRYGPGTTFGVCVNVPYGTPVLAVYEPYPQMPYGWVKLLYNGRTLWAASMYLAPM